MQYNSAQSYAGNSMSHLCQLASCIWQRTRPTVCVCGMCGMCGVCGVHVCGVWYVWCVWYACVWCMVCVVHLCVGEGVCKVGGESNL